MKIRRNYLHVVWRVPVLIAWMVLMPLLFFVLRMLRIDWHRELPHYFHRGLQLIFGLQVKKSGTASDQRPTLYVSNHISYLDVFVLGEIRAFYIAKSEVANWPILGQLARFQNTLFFERKAGRAQQQLKVLRDHLSGGQSLIFFPEGTSTDGAHVEPFKSTLFEAARQDESGAQVAIQPVTVAYTHQAGIKMNQPMRDNYAWYAKMPFTPHFFNLFSLQKVAVKVHFHPVIYLEQFTTRKECAEYCQKLVSDKLIELLEE